MVTIGGVGRQVEIENMHDGQGQTLAHGFFEGKIEPSMMFFDLVLKPGTYGGYHRHVGNEEIIYIVSGKAESLHDGSRHTLGAGDAILIKAGQAHAVRNISDGDLKILGFVAAPGSDAGSVENLPLPDALTDWE